MGKKRMFRWMSQVFLLKTFMMLLIALSPPADQAQAQTVSLGHATAQDMNASISIYEDKSAKLKIEDILQPDLDSQFIPRENLHRNGFGFTRSAIWVKASVRNDSDQKTWVVGSPRPDFATMDVYVIDENGDLFETLAIGTSEKNRELSFRLPSGRIHLDQNRSYTIYLKIESPLQLSLTFFLMDESHYLNYAIRENSFHAAYFGTVIALILYNLSLFLFLRHRDYIFYVVVGLAMVLNVYVQSGFAEVASFRLPFLNSTADAYRIILFPSIASMLYTQSFLRLKTIAPLLSRMMTGLASLGALFAVFLWTDGSFAFRSYASFFDAAAVILVFAGSIIAIRKGDKSARIFLVAWGIFATSVIIWVMGNMGFLEKNDFIASSPQMGNMCEMVLMSIALALRIKELDKKKAQAEMKAREKDNLQHLLRMVCHDISNPLSIIKTVFFLSTRRVGVMPEDVQQWARIKRASDSIEGIINQVRKYEAFRSGKLAFELKPCSLAKVFEDIEFFFHARAQEKEIRLTCSFQGELKDIHVVADSISLTHEIMNNLISNAIKFTHSGGFVKVEASVVDGRVVITVKDNGIGIPAGDLDRIFASDGKTSREGTSREAGTGFGMPLVKTFLDLFSGEISIRSKEKRHDQKDHGTTITIKLNLAP